MKRIIVLIIVLAVLAAGVYYVRSADQREQTQIATLYKEVEPLQKERTNLIAERKELVEEFRVSLRDPSTVQFLFRELGEDVFNVIYPIMRERGVTGVLGMSTKSYPSRNHMLTVEQYNRLLMDGWGSCLIFDKSYSSDVEGWLSSMKRHLEREGISLPTTIFFPDGGYDAEAMDGILLSYGVNTIVLNAEDGHSGTVTSVGEMWITGAMPWNYTGIGSDVELLSVTDSANLCFTVSIENLWDAFDSKAFTALLDSWESFLLPSMGADPIATPTPLPTVAVTLPGQEPEVEPKLLVTSFEKARSAHRTADEDRNVLVTEHEEAVAEYDRRIEELNAQIEEVYAKWNTIK